MVSKWKLEKHKENNEKKIWEHINKVSDNKRKVGVKKQIKGQPHPKIWKTNQILQTQHNISRRSKKKKKRFYQEIWKRETKCDGNTRDWRTEIILE